MCKRLAYNSEVYARCSYFLFYYLNHWLWPCWTHAISYSFLSSDVKAWEQGWELSPALVAKASKNLLPSCLGVWEIFYMIVRMNVYNCVWIKGIAYVLHEWFCVAFPAGSAYRESKVIESRREVKSCRKHGANQVICPDVFFISVPRK